jgi:tetratricopeptide (TPR) repeat protein
VALWQEVIEIQRRVLGPEDPDTLQSMNNLANVYGGEGKYAQAETLEQKALETRRRVLGPEDPDTLQSMNNLAFAYANERKYAQAEALDSQTIEMERRILGPEHPDTLQTMSNLAAAYDDDGKYAQAEDVFRQGVKNAPNNVPMLNGDAWRLLTAKDRRFRRPREALDLARKAVSLDPQKGGDLNTLGLAEVRNGLWDDAITTLNKSIALSNNSQPSDFFFLAMAYQGRGDAAEAEKNYAHGAEMARVPAESDPELRMLWVEAAKALGKPVPKLTSAK